MFASSPHLRLRSWLKVTGGLWAFGPQTNLLRFAALARVFFYLQPILTVSSRCRRMRTILYGKKAANLYTQAFVQNTQARALYQESEDTYYRANDAASYDDWRRARHQWDYFYNRH